MDQWMSRWVLVLVGCWNGGEGGEVWDGDGGVYGDGGAWSRALVCMLCLD